MVTGPIAEAESLLLWRAFLLMLILVVPVIFLTLLAAWRYRASNTSAVYKPEWGRSRVFEIVVWGIPAVMIALLATMVWDKTHKLDPYKQLPGAAPMEIQAIAFDWKWVFIYPELGIATINEVALPVGAPVEFFLTSDVALNSFIIPSLGGQIYAMAGMETRLNLQADTPGRVQGRNMQFNGEGFADQTFETAILDEADFEAWVAKARTSGAELNAATLADLRKPSVSEPVAFFSTVSDEFFQDLISSHSGMAHHSSEPKGESTQ